MDLSIVIVNWNSCDHLEKCLASIEAHGALPEHEIVVIDSGSFDGSDRMVASRFPHVRYLQSADNLGFARANNLAFAATTADAVLFLNPDTEVVGGAIETLHAAMMSLPDAGVVGCRLLNTDGTVQWSCIQSIPTIINQLLGADVLLRRFPRSRLWGMAPLLEEGSTPREVEAVSGACVLVRREAFMQVGRFSEDYFMYAEDIDLSCKMRQAGFRNYYVPSAEVIHHGGSSSSQAASAFGAVMMREALWRFFRKTRGVAYAAAYRMAMLCVAIARLSVLGPGRVAGSRNPSLSASWQKWIAILRWSVHQDGIVRRYYRVTS